MRVFSDEMYRHLEHEPGLTLPSAADMAPDAVILGGMSKSMALPGIRIGWLATRDKALMHEVRGMKDFTTICASAPSEVRLSDDVAACALLQAAICACQGQRPIKICIDVACP